MGLDKRSGVERRVEPDRRAKPEGVSQKSPAVQPKLAEPAKKQRRAGVKKTAA